MIINIIIKEYLQRKRKRERERKEIDSGCLFNYPRMFFHKRIPSREFHLFRELAREKEKREDGSFSGWKLNFLGLSSSSPGLNLRDYYLLRGPSSLSLSLLFAFPRLILKRIRSCKERQLA